MDNTLVAPIFGKHLVSESYGIYSHIFFFSSSQATEPKLFGTFWHWL